MSDQPEQQDRKASPYLGMNAGYTMLASVILGLGLGYALDLWLESLPWGDRLRRAAVYPRGLVSSDQRGAAMKI